MVPPLIGAVVPVPRRSFGEVTAEVAKVVVLPSKAFASLVNAEAESVGPESEALK